MIVHRIRLVLFALTMNSKITAFITGRLRQDWLFTRYGKFYVRKSAHMVPGDGLTRYGNFISSFVLVKTLDIAAVEIYEKYQRQYFFASALRCFENRARANGVPVIYVENVHNPDLYKMLTRRGYAPAQHDRCLYRRVDG